MPENNKVGLIQFTILTTVSMIDGIIMLPTMVATVGAISVYAWIETISCVMILAYAFAKCGAYSTRSGGLGGYAEYAFGKSGNFIANFTYAIALMIANVGIAISVVAYSSVFFYANLSPADAAFLAGLVMIMTTAANFWGTGMTVKLGFTAMMCKLIPAAIMSICGLYFFDPQIFNVAWNPHHYTVTGAIGAANSFTLWAFLGLESACSNMDRVVNPRRNVPIAVISATAIIGLFSIIYTTVIQGIVPNSVLSVSNAPFGDAFAYMYGSLAGRIVTAFMIFGCAGALIAWQFTLGELLRESADEGYFPEIFGKVTKDGVPVKGMIVMVIIQLVMIFCTISPTMVKQFDVLIQLATVDNLVPYVLAMAALDIMQKQAGHNDRMTRMAAVIGGAYSLYATYQCGMDAVTAGMMTVLLGYMIYGVYAGQKPYTGCL